MGTVGPWGQYLHGDSRSMAGGKCFFCVALLVYCLLFIRLSLYITVNTLLYIDCHLTHTKFQNFEFFFLFFQMVRVNSKNTNLMTLQ